MALPVGDEKQEASWLTTHLSQLMTERLLTVEMLARSLAIERSRLKNILEG